MDKNKVGKGHHVTRDYDREEHRRHEVNTMTCYVCKGKMIRVKKEVQTFWKGIAVTFKGMDVWVCSSCGEEAYEPDDVAYMQRVISRKLEGWW